jgi:hypothetical protein
MLDAWQPQVYQPSGEMVTRVWGGNGLIRRCLLTGQHRELPVDVVEVRMVAADLQRGYGLPAHGTVTIDVRSEHVWHALKEIARSRDAYVLQRPDGGVLEMRFGGTVTTNTQKLVAGAPMRPVATFDWHAP